MASSFSYSKIDSEYTWLTRSFRFLLGSAPPRPRAEGPRASRISQYARRIVGLRRRNSASEHSSGKQSKSNGKPGSMESTTTEGAAATQVELRTEGFQATLLWERIVSHLERTVKTGRHSYALRHYDNCFPGHKAVDCLMVYMNSVLPKSVKKCQARLLGQKLLLTKVIEDARKKEKTVFRESRLYRFTGIHFWDPPHGARTCTTAEGVVYRCHSIENVSHGCPSAREQKHKSSGRRNGYTSDSTLASSSLGKRVVQVRSSRGKPAPRLAGDSHVKSHYSTNVTLTPTSSGLPSEGASAYHSQQPSSHKSRLPWFHSDSGARARDVRSKYRTPTITEEPAILRSMSPPRASPRSPAFDFKVREPRIAPIHDRSRGLPMYLERPRSPDSSIASGFSSYSRESEDSSLRCRDYALQNHRPDIHQRLVPRAAVPSAASPKHCNVNSDSNPHGACSNEQDPGWVVYGYV